MNSRVTERREVTALSLGAGWGSVGMSLLLEKQWQPGFPKPDVAIFADTQAEPPHVYETLDWLEERVSWPIIRATFSDLWTNTWKQIRREVVPDRHHYNTEKMIIDIPVFGSAGGMGKRQCTTTYKIDVIKRTLRAHFELNPPYLRVKQYIGMSLDEVSRMKEAKEKYLTNVYPLIECGFTRQDLIEFMEEFYPGSPVGRSACFFCPFHSIQEWRDIRRQYPGLYEEAIEMERAMCRRDNGPWFLYKGKYGLGLEQAMARADLEGGELAIEPNQFENECEGMCNS